MEKKKRAQGLGELRSLGPLLRQSRFHLSLGLVSIAGMSLFTALIPWYIRAAIDELAFHPESAILLSYAALLICLTVIQGCFRYLMRRLLIGASRVIEYRLRGRLFAHLLTLDASFFDRWRTGDLMSRLTNDLNAVRMAVGPGLMNIASTVSVLSLALVMMVRIEPVLTLFTLAPFPLLSLLVLFIGRRVHRRFLAIQNHYSDMSAAVQENLSGIRVVKAYDMERREVGRFEGLSREYMKRNIALARLSGLFMPVIQSVTGITVLLMLWLGGTYVVNSRITIGAFVAFMAYLAMLVWPMVALGWVVNLLQRGAASMGRINEVLRTAPAIEDPESPEQDPVTKGELAFEGVGFAYDDTPVLDNIHLTIRPGEVLGIVGPTGSGKSTLAKLIPRLYDPVSGRVTLNGADLRTLPLERLRRLVGFVPQEPFLFSISVKDNIALSGELARSSDLSEAVEAAGFDSDIARMPSGWDTLVGERGVTLSGGQKQKAALSRVLVKHPEILVLDDAFSSMDTESASKALLAITELAGYRTLIVISHRIPQVSWANRIVVLEGGRITAEGRHEELLECSDFYRKLHNRQMLEEELQ